MFAGIILSHSGSHGASGYKYKISFMTFVVPMEGNIKMHVLRCAIMQFCPYVPTFWRNLLMKVRGSSKAFIPVCETTHNGLPDDQNLVHNFLTSSVFVGQVKPELLS
jgi:hypothetical protein